LCFLFCFTTVTICWQSCKNNVPNSWEVFIRKQDRMSEGSLFCDIWKRQRGLAGILLCWNYLSIFCHTCSFTQLCISCFRRNWCLFIFS
jgi:hypothetical protein